MTSIYLAGPMRSIEAFNFPAFAAATDELRSQGHVVWSPAEHDVEGGFDPTGMTGDEDLAEVGFDLAAALAWDLHTICTAVEAVVVLPGWEHSTGAQHEVATARMLGLPVLAYPDMTPITAPERSIMQEAHDLVNGARRANYGHPADDYARTVGAFNALTGHRLTIGDGIVFQQCVKQARQQNHPKRDNNVDLAGYAGCAELVVEAGRWFEVP